jgi:hypothetical protein
VYYPFNRSALIDGAGVTIVYLRFGELAMAPLPRIEVAQILGTLIVIVLTRLQLNGFTLVFEPTYIGAFPLGNAGARDVFIDANLAIALKIGTRAVGAAAPGLGLVAGYRRALAATPDRARKQTDEPTYCYWNTHIHHPSPRRAGTYKVGRRSGKLNVRTWTHATY